MKTFLLCSIVAAFACVSAQAGDSKDCCDKAAAAKAKAAACESGSGCCSKQIVKKADSTAKGASQLIAKR